MTAAQLMKALGVSRKTVTRYVEAGCPHEREGTGKRAPLVFDLAVVKAWMKQTARTGDQGRPLAGLEAAPRDRAARAAAPGDKPTDDLDPDADEDLQELLRRVNLEIKRLEVRKRERLEREADGELVPLDEVRRAWGAQVEVVKARFRVLPSTLAQQLLGRSYAEMHDIIDEELRNVLRAFAREELAL